MLEESRLGVLKATLSGPSEALYRAPQVEVTAEGGINYGRYMS
jgi:hypothetical protein